ncbi:uncharacterized protein EI97DRAFT_423269 [Westerdykella ornata]|uniref:Oxidoreductase-like protein n=1 Tax=Westerdykella ornata TaxID=318751 RepID=A0A6A6JBD9_WESOR|nr:uncharacterized protein EI97DRAFT_423269 [Westerdykella ornata]KAF2273930.1 hypothetical protein EI97DRAFT_423269 [Westerdykella ornata]
MSAVEAKSLSSLTALASNPPAYPRNPTHVKHEPLVLYIARVPGSRDVFLSPLKPRDKVVTAEDIQSCLYYVHVNEPEDVRLISQVSPVEARESPLVTGNPALTGRPISRKAVPSSPPPVSAPTVPRRKPVAGALSPVNDFDNSNNVHASTYYRYSQETPGSEFAQSSATCMPEAELKPPLPPRRPPEYCPSPLGTSLTLIRRDPASGAQWNVACIDDPAVFDVSSSAVNDASARKRAGAPIYIEVTNPGYSKFLNGPEFRPDLIARMGDLTAISPQSNWKAQANVAFAPAVLPAAGDEAYQDDTLFRRRLWMETGKHQSSHKRTGSHELYLGRRRLRSSSEASPTSTDNSAGGTPLDTQDQPHSFPDPEIKSSFRGYVFLSPWNGRCEFVTGAAGGSLKARSQCRHVVPGLQGAPPAVTQVSELRFNLPSSSKSSSTASDEPVKRSSIFHRSKHARNNSSASEMDLSLGQEHAGGGYGGKQAKLGKLIIEDEGLKMLDLLVAANMALYWRAYEKVDARSRGDRSST